MTRALLLACALAGCGLPAEAPMVRVVEGRPTGPGVDTAVEPSIRFSGPIAPEGLLDGRRFLLVRAADRAGALSAVESDEGAGAGVALPRAAGVAALVDGATRLVFRPAQPLAPGASWALVLSSRVSSPDGRHVLDAEGRLRPTVVEFATAALPPPGVLLTEVLADAATPEAGGEYAEVLNLGPGLLDLSGWRFEKRTAAGAWSGCTVGESVGGAVEAGGVALVVGGGWDGRYALPEGTATFPCGSTSLAGGIANDRPPEIRLLDPSGAAAAILDGSGSERCAGALEADPPPPGGGEVVCCRCTEGSPGWIPAAVP